MTIDQLRFIRLHQRCLVAETRELFQGAMVRAVSDRGISATLRLDELEDLINAGLVAPRNGAFAVTEQGRAV